MSAGKEKTGARDLAEVAAVNHPALNAWIGFTNADEKDVVLFLSLFGAAEDNEQLRPESTHEGGRVFPVPKERHQPVDRLHRDEVEVEVFASNILPLAAESECDFATETLDVERVGRCPADAEKLREADLEHEAYRTVQAAVPGAVIDITQVGANVVVTGSGVIDLSGLTFLGTGPLPGFGIIWPDAAEILVGTGNVDLYTGATGPTSMGTGAETLADTGSGGQFGVGDLTGTTIIFVPAGYDGTTLSSSSTFDNTTLAKLGFSPGTYTYTWAPSPTAEDGSLTINVTGGVPEPSTWAMMLAGFAALGYAGYRRSRRARLEALA